MHITNQKLSFDIFTVQNIFKEHDPNNFWHKIKIDHFDPYNVLIPIHRFHAATILKSKAKAPVGRNPEVKLNNNDLDYQPRAATAI